MTIPRQAPRGSPRSAAAAAAFTGLVIALFRVHGRVTASGERLVASLGLTGAKWQVLGALSLGGEPMTVPSIATAMGLTRQGVQKQVDLMAADGLVTVRENPAHKRSQLIAITAAGARVYGRAMRRQAVWARELTSGLEAKELDAATALLRRIEERISSRDEGREGRDGKETDR
jgi:DNA-binding MarR family transcriptional regulator